MVSRLLILLLVLQLVLPWAASAQPVPVNLDLTSSNRNTPTGGFMNNSPVSIVVGGANKTINPGDMLTPAERLAAFQVVSTGQQSIQLGAQGNAIGGSFHMGANFGQYVSNLVIPQGVTAVRDFGTASALNLSGNLTNAGTLYGVSTNNAITTAVINATNIYNQPGALISTVLPSGGLPGVNNAVSNLSLTLNAINDIVNAGRITSAGALSLNAGGSIVNALPSGISGAAPVMQAAQNLNLFAGSGSIVNNGLLNSLNGNINIGTAAGQNLSLNGGDLIAQEINVLADQAIANISVGNLQGVLNITAGEAHVNAATDNLVLGKVCVSGDPTFYNTTGGVQISSPMSFAGTALAVVANTNITTASGVGAINTSSTTGNGGSILLVAGANFTAAGTITINGQSTSGGYIDLTGGTGQGGGSNGITSFTSASSAAGFRGGNITMVAYRGTTPGTNAGAIFAPTGVTINAGGGGGTNGNNGTVTVIAGATTSNGISLGNVSANSGLSGTGGISISSGTPSSSAVALNADGSINTGSFTSTASTAANMQVGNLSSNGGSVSLTSAGNVGVNSITAGSVAINATGSTSTVTVASGSTVAATAGNVTINTYNLANNGTISAAGAGGGNIVISSPGSLNITSLGTLSATASTGNINLLATAGNLTFPGSANFSTGGANFFAAATGNVTSAGSSGVLIDATNSYSVNGGSFKVGAGVTFTTTNGVSTITGTSSGGGNLSLGSLGFRTNSNTANFEAHTGSSASGTLSMGSIETSGAGGGIGLVGKAGGNVTVTADGNVSTTYIRAYGGGGGGAAFSGGDGGAGGTVTVTSNLAAVTIAGDVNSSGGGGGGSNTNWGVGGAGKNITITAVGNISIDGPVLAAGGGGGGNATGANSSGGGGSFGGGGGGDDENNGLGLGGGGLYGGVGFIGGGIFSSGAIGSGDAAFGSAGTGLRRPGGDVGAQGGGNGGAAGAGGVVTITGMKVAINQKVSTAFSGTAFSTSPFAAYSANAAGIGGSIKITEVGMGSISQTYNANGNYLNQSRSLTAAITGSSVTFAVGTSPATTLSGSLGTLGATGGVFLNSTTSAGTTLSTGNFNGTGSSITVTEAGSPRVISNGTSITPAELVAMIQVFNGNQTLTLDSTGNAVGGTMTIASTNVPSGGFTGLAIPASVTANVGVSSLTLSGTTTVNGNLSSTSALTLTNSGALALAGTGLIDAPTVQLTATGAITYGGTGILPLSNLVGSGHNLGITAGSSFTLEATSGATTSIGSLTLQGTAITLRGSSSTAATVSTSGAVQITSTTSGAGVNIGSASRPIILNAGSNNVTLTANQSGSVTAISEETASGIVTSGTLMVNLPIGTSGTTASLLGTQNNVATLNGSGTGVISFNNGANSLTLGTFASTLGVAVNTGSANPGTVSTSTSATNVASLALTGSTVNVRANVDATTMSLTSTSTNTGSTNISAGSAVLHATTLSVNVAAGTAQLTGNSNVATLNGSGNGTLQFNNGSNALQLGTVSLGSLSLTGSSISETGSSSLSVSNGLTLNLLSGGTATLTAGSNNVNALTVSGSGSANFDNGSNALQLQTSGSSISSLTAAAGSLTVANPLNATSAITLQGTTVTNNSTITAPSISFSKSSGMTLSGSGTLSSTTGVSFSSTSGSVSATQGTITGTVTGSAANSFSAQTTVSNLNVGNVTAGGTITIAVPSTKSLSISMTGNIGSAANNVSTTANNLTLNSTGNIYVSNTGNVNLTLSSTPTNFKLTNSGTVTPTADINASTSLEIHSTGSITSGSFGFKSPAGTVTLISDSGDVGTVSNRVNTTAGTLSVQANGTNKSVYVTELDGVTLGTLSASSTVDLTAGGTINSTGSSSVTAGSNIKVWNTGNLSVSGSGSMSAPTVQFNAPNGSATIAQSAIAGTVSVTADQGITLNTTSATSGLSLLNVTNNNNSVTVQTGGGVLSVANGGSVTTNNGNVYLVVGSIPASPVAGSTPGNVTYEHFRGGKAFFGASGLTAAAPSNTVRADGTNVVFSAPSASSIQLGGGTLISALGPRSAKVNSLDLTDPAVVSLLVSYQQDSSIGGTLLTTGGIASGGTLILDPGVLETLTAANIPQNVQVTFKGFESGNNVAVSLTAASTTKQVIINGTYQFVGNTAGASNSTLSITSTQPGVSLVVGGSGRLSSDGTITVNTNGTCVTSEGSLEAPNFTLSTGNVGIGTLAAGLSFNVGTLHLNTTSNAYLQQKNSVNLGTSNIGGLLSVIVNTGDVTTSGTVTAGGINVLMQSATGNVTVNGALNIGTQGATFYTSGTGAFTVAATGSVTSDNSLQKIIGIGSGGIVLRGTMSAGTNAVAFDYGGRTMTLGTTAAPGTPDGAYQVSNYTLSHVHASELLIGHAFVNRVSGIDLSVMPARFVAINTFNTYTSDPIIMGTNRLSIDATGYVAPSTITMGPYALPGQQLLIQTSGTISLDGQVSMTGNGQMVLVGNGMNIPGTINAPNSQIVFQTKTNSTTMAIADSADGNGNDAMFDVNASELNRITAKEVSFRQVLQTPAESLRVLGDLNVIGTGAGKYNLSFQLAGNYVATGHTMTLGDKYLIVSSLGTVNTGSVAGAAASFGNYGAVNFSSKGTLTLDGTITTENLGKVYLTTTSGGNGNIVIAGSVGQKNSIVTISADGSGSITQTSGCITGSTSLTSGTGNIGPLTTSASSLQLKTLGTVNVNNVGTGTLEVRPSSSGGAFNITSAGSLTVNGVTTQNGGITLVSGNQLTVAAGTTVFATGGDIILRSTNTQTGVICIGKNATVKTFVEAGDTTKGNVYITIGAIPTNPVVGYAPAYTTVNKVAGGKVFFGAKGIAGYAPQNTINAIARNVVFNTGTRGPGAINLGGGVTITADPPVPGYTLPETPVNVPPVSTLPTGEHLIRPSTPVSLNLAGHDVRIAANSAAVIHTDGSTLKVSTLHESTSNGVQININNQWLTVHPGQEISLNTSTTATTDGIGRRNRHTSSLPDGSTLTRSEFSMTSLLSNSAALRTLLRSNVPADRALAAKIIKTAAALMQVTASHGAYR